MLLTHAIRVDEQQPIDVILHTLNPETSIGKHLMHTNISVSAVVNVEQAYKQTYLCT